MSRSGPRRARRVRSALAALLGALLVGAPTLASACSACSAGRDEETRLAFILTTVFMSALPLLMLGTAGWWLRRRLREMERAEAEARADAVAGGAVSRASSAP